MSLVNLSAGNPLYSYLQGLTGNSHLEMYSGLTLLEYVVIVDLLPQQGRATQVVVVVSTQLPSRILEEAEQWDGNITSNHPKKCKSFFSVMIGRVSEYRETEAYLPLPLKKALETHREPNPYDVSGNTKAS